MAYLFILLLDSLNYLILAVDLLINMYIFIINKTLKNRTKTRKKKNLLESAECVSEA